MEGLSGSARGSVRSFVCAAGEEHEPIRTRQAGHREPLLVAFPFVDHRVSMLGEDFSGLQANRTIRILHLLINAQRALNRGGAQTCSTGSLMRRLRGATTGARWSTKAESGAHKECEEPLRCGRIRLRGPGFTRCAHRAGRSRPSGDDPLR
jgi:hypothetical protein